jgi:hypothetical protein
MVDAADLGLLLSMWGKCKCCPADIDGNGQVDGSDLAWILADWS